MLPDLLYSLGNFSLLIFCNIAHTIFCLPNDKMENGWDKSGEKAFSRTCKSSASTGSLEVNPGRLAFAPNRPDDPVGVLVSSPSETDEASTRSTAEETSDQPLELQREPPPEGFPDFSMSTSTAKSENTIELKNGDFPSDQELAEREAIRDLSLALPGLPMGRLKRIRSAFTTSLTYPSLLALVPLLREKMPDYVSSAWLKKMNTRNAEFALGKAVEDGIMDVHVLNAILQVKTSAGSLDKALEFHRDEFRKNELVSIFRCAEVPNRQCSKYWFDRSSRYQQLTVTG